MSFSSTTVPGKVLTVFTLTMINVIAVDSLRSLTMGAVYGSAVVFFYIIAAFIFFIPTILVSAELATGWSSTGGVYIWVREAFGPYWGFLTIWLQWVYNLVWYPTIFSFIAATLAYLINPHLVDNKVYMLSVILVLLWGATLVNCLGIKASSLVSVLGAILGTLLPMLFIILLGIIWLGLNKPTQLDFSWAACLPKLNDINNLAFLTTLLFGLMGMEMSAVHAGDVRNPKRDYPRALFYSGLLILVTLVCASLAIVIVVPSTQLNLVSGLVDAFAIFFNAYHLGWLIPVLAVLIIIGSLSGASAWLIGPPRGLLIASQDSKLSLLLQKTNRHNMPVGILVLQALIVTILCSIFLLMPTVNSAYWILSDLTAQLALLFYIVLFAAAIRLRYKHHDTSRAFTIPGGKLGMWIVAGIGICACIGAILIGFLPPTQPSVGNVTVYESILVGGILIFCLPPLGLYKLRKSKVLVDGSLA